MTETKTLDAQGLEIRYYRSFASYEIPFQPEDEIPFAETQGLRSFYIGYHRQDGRVVRLVKILLVREGVRDVALPEREEPGSTIYFRVDRQPEERGAEVGMRVDYADTEAMMEIFEGQAGASGWDCRAILFRREQAFRDTYSYWPNGQLNTRTLWRSDGRRSVWHFDEAGNPLEPARAAACDSSTEPAR